MRTLLDEQIEEFWGGPLFGSVIEVEEDYAEEEEEDYAEETLL